LTTSPLSFAPMMRRPFAQSCRDKLGTSLSRQRHPAHNHLIDRTALAYIRGNADPLVDTGTIAAHSPTCAQFPGRCSLTTPTFSFAPMVRRPFAQPGLGQ
jgi:hypothetical protein